MIELLDYMQAQKKIVPEISPQEEVLRPNIDHLIKRIIEERRQEKRNTIMLVIPVLLVIVALFYFYTQN
tara:strand:- start:287 stop:493 length:207 start_codon:yes stop_codon:yes gene_type:complete